jgi:hypothetical protein
MEMPGPIVPAAKNNRDGEVQRYFSPRRGDEPPQLCALFLSVRLNAATSVVRKRPRWQ